MRRKRQGLLAARAALSFAIELIDRLLNDQYHGLTSSLWWSRDLEARKDPGKEMATVDPATRVATSMVLHAVELFSEVLAFAAEETRKIRVRQKREREGRELMDSSDGSDMGPVV